MPEIQKPTIGRIVHYHRPLDGLVDCGPHRERERIDDYSTDGVDTEAPIVAAVVSDHWGDGLCLLSPAGYGCVLRAKYGAREDGTPKPGCWAYPPMVRDTINVLD